VSGRVILDLCAGSGAWSQPYVDRGYEVIRVTLPEDVRLVHRSVRHVHGILAAPPCTVFASSGARWSRTEWQMIEGLSVVDACLRAVVLYQPAWWALENPVGTLSRYLGPPAMTFQPWQYGDPYVKRTCLWGRFTPLKKRPVEPVLGALIHRMAPSPERTAKRSITPAGFAEAFFESNP